MRPPWSRTPLPPWSLSSVSLAASASQVKDVAVVGPGRPVKGAEAAARDADVGVVDIPVDDEGDPVAGIEAPAHLIGRGPQGQEVQVPQFRRLGRIQTSVLFKRLFIANLLSLRPHPNPLPQGERETVDSLIADQSSGYLDSLTTDY